MNLLNQLEHYTNQPTTTRETVDKIHTALKAAIDSGDVYDYAVVTPNTTNIKIAVKYTAHDQFTTILERNLIS